MNRQHSARKLQVIMFIHVYTATCNTSHIESSNNIKRWYYDLLSSTM